MPKKRPRVFLLRLFIAGFKVGYYIGAKANEIKKRRKTEFFHLNPFKKNLRGRTQSSSPCRVVKAFIKNFSFAVMPEGDSRNQNHRGKKPARCGSSNLEQNSSIGRTSLYIGTAERASGESKRNF